MRHADIYKGIYMGRVTPSLPDLTYQRVSPVSKHRGTRAMPWGGGMSYTKPRASSKIETKKTKCKLNPNIRPKVDL